MAIIVIHRRFEIQEQGCYGLKKKKVLAQEPNIFDNVIHTQGQQTRMEEEEKKWQPTTKMTHVR